MTDTINFKIKEITAEETYIVRHPVLRTGKPISTCIFEGDDLKSTIHFGLFVDNKIVGVATFMKNNHELLNEPAQYQLRGMAILNDYQGLGLGAKMLLHGEASLQSKNVKLIWCNAREVAFNFYKRNGYETIGVPFDIPDIGTHFVMHKSL